jgi:pimeloyl-ACP methyl ester carboxylesterase
VSGSRAVLYAPTQDGAHLAYRKSGTGDMPVLDIGAFGSVFSIDATSEQPLWQRFEDDLGRFCQLIRFDSRGMGLSDRFTGPPTVEQWADDALAVLDAAGADRAAVIGTGYGAPVAVHLAATHPDRVTALVLANAFARVVADVDYPAGIPAHLFAELASRTVPDRDIGADIDLIAPSVADDPEMRGWWSRESRRGLDPRSAGAMWQFFGVVDVRPTCAALAVPTLVLRSTRNAFVLPAHGDWLADHIEGARLVDLDAADHLLWAVPGDRVAGEIEEFLTGRRDRSVGHSVLVAIMFTDIAGSTTRNAAAGNAAWLNQLASLESVTAQELRRFGGTLVKTLGDGALATFTTPSLSVRCARSIVDRVAELDIPIRVAIHAAEVDLRDGDVLGIGVTIASRALEHASAGEVVVTSTVADLLLGSPLTFVPSGRHALKGVPGLWELATLAP